MDMAKIGPGVAGGNNRQALTDDDSTARHLFQSWCAAEGLSLHTDKMGNMFARRDGCDASLPPVMVGSHLDTQPTGGKYDGPLGVLAALEIIRSLNEAGLTTRHPIEIVNWTNEEGCRFAPPMMASGVFAGVHDLDWAYDRTDAAGARFGDELERIGWVGDAAVGGRPVAAFFELHIEQGPILEDSKTDIGVVTHGQGLNWIRVTLTGKEAHTGSTPMPSRVNAGLGMAQITVLAHQIALAHAPHAVGAVGHCESSPTQPISFREKRSLRLIFAAPIRRSSRRCMMNYAMAQAQLPKRLGLALILNWRGRLIRWPLIRPVSTVFARRQSGLAIRIWILFQVLDMMLSG